MLYFCEWCGNTKAADLDETFVFWPHGCDCDMTRWRLIDLSKDEADFYYSVLGEFRNRVATEARPGVYMRPFSGDMDPYLLDLYVLLFSHVLLDPSLLTNNKWMQERLVAYSEAGVVTPIYLHSKAYFGVADSRADQCDPLSPIPGLEAFAVNATYWDREILPQVVYGAPILRSIDQIASAEFHYSFSGLLKNEHDTVRKAYEASTRAMDCYPSGFEYFARCIKIQELTADCLGSDPLLDPVLSVIDRHLRPGDTKLREVDEATTLSCSAHGLVEWYVEKLADLPRLDDPKAVLRLRDEGGGAFVDTVHREVAADVESYRTFDQAIGELGDHLDRIIRSASMREKAQPVLTIASGLIGALGGLVRPPFGTVFGGMTGSGLAYLSGRLTKASPSWTSFFLSKK